MVPAMYFHYIALGKRCYGSYTLRSSVRTVPTKYSLTASSTGTLHYIYDIQPTIPPASLRTLYVKPNSTRRQTHHLPQSEARYSAPHRPARRTSVPFILHIPKAIPLCTPCSISFTIAFLLDYPTLRSSSLAPSRIGYLVYILM